ncbi:hypothetical protein TA3x_004859 [Tundrisphaera sp. TA3]|uniref:hypothetical protein n=1 Tax=Tundrisphaera sp. TA3 TaxID=3435775 RepID=UPI003EB91CF5
MNRRSPALYGILGLVSFIAGCDYGSGPAPVFRPDQVRGPLPTQGRQAAPAAPAFDPSAALGELSDQEKKRRDAILNRVITLMKSAAINPAGGQIRIATDSLNELFEQGTIASDYAVSAGEARFLELKLPELFRDPQPVVDQIISKKFTDRDARHIEDCMFYHVVATRVAGEGDELTRVRRIFDWVLRQVQLVPPNSLSGDGIPQAEVRPADALFRGMGVEQGGRWSERGWLFMALCRQIGVDVGILTYSPRRASGPVADQAAPAQPPVAWACAAAIGKELYLFDAALGMPIPGPDGTGVATLNQAIEIPDVLDRLSLPDQHYTYRASRADLTASPTKIGVLVDSSLAYMAPRMRLLQGQLRGEYKTILFRDPAEQAVKFREALGPRFGGTTLWELPIKVETLLFSDAEFVQSTLISLRFFDPKLPLMLARTAQLRGDLPDALQRLATLRFADNPVMNNKEQTPIPPEVQQGLDVYATCFLAECQLDSGYPDKAEEIYRKALDLIPEPGPGRNAFYMLRWSAQSNLARLCEARGDVAGAIDFYTRPDPTPQHVGNLIRARELVWADPFADPIPTPPPAPADRSGPPPTATNP